MRIDLHTHSTVSDGTDTPTELMTKAAEVGLDVIALTDHDTSAGWAEAEKALADGMTLVRGAELSCESPDGTGGHHTVHLLAYLFDPESPALVREQLRLREERRQRLRRMANLMAADGFPVDPDEIMADVPEDGAAGRPHLARALVRAAVTWARARHCVGLELTCGLNPARENAHRFYPAMGFQADAYRYWMPFEDAGA